MTALIHLMMCLSKDISQRGDASARGKEEDEANGAGLVKCRDGPVAEGYDHSQVEGGNGKHIEKAHSATSEQARPQKAKPVMIFSPQWARKGRGHFRLRR